MNTTVAKQHIAHALAQGMAADISRGIELSKSELIDAVIAAQDAPEQRREQLQRTVYYAVCRLIHNIASRNYMQWAPQLPSSVEYDDIYMAGCEGMVKALGKYDRNRINPENGERYAFTTVVTQWTTQAVQRCIYSRVTHMKVGWDRIRTGGVDIGRAITDSSLSVFDEYDDSSDDRLSVLACAESDQEFERADSRHEVRRIMGAVGELGLAPRHLSTRLKILKLVMEGYTTDQIGERVGYTGQRVRQLIDKTGWELEQAGLV